MLSTLVLVFSGTSKATLEVLNKPIAMLFQAVHNKRSWRDFSREQNPRASKPVRP